MPVLTQDPTGDVPLGRSSGSKNPHRARLSREEVLAGALRVVDDEGLDKLTMRRLGQQLGRDPMALYRYAPNRAALLDGVVETVLSELLVPVAGGNWKDELRSGAHAFRELALAHPHVVPLLVTRPLLTPLGLRPLGVLRPLERLLALLMDSGFTPANALHAYREYTGLLAGHVLNELQELVVNPDENIALLRLGLYRLPAREFPTLRGLADILGDYDGATELNRGLDTLFHGLDAELQKTPQPAIDPVPSVIRMSNAIPTGRQNNDRPRNTR